MIFLLAFAVIPEPVLARTVDQIETKLPLVSPGVPKVDFSPDEQLGLIFHNIFDDFSRNDDWQLELDFLIRSRWQALGFCEYELFRSAR